jgi:MarR family transcriptional regulator, negative regulator of the multidrug operon emrRAB
MHQSVDRLANLLGATALVAADRMRVATRSAALVHLQAWPGGSIEALRHVLNLSQPAAVRVVDRLAHDGLIERRAGKDARTLSLHLTAQGDAEATAVLERRGQALRAMLAPLDDDERARLEPLLERLVSSLAHDRAGALTTCRLCDRGACTSGPGCPLEHTA